MKICLINPSYSKVRSEDEEYNYSGFTLPHLGLGYIASHLEQCGYTVDILECMGQNISTKELYEILLKNEYDMIGISIYEANKKDSFKILNFIEKNIKKSFVFAGGYTATLSSEQILRVCSIINCCVLGEGEETILDLANKISQGEDYKNVYGISYLEDGQYIKNKKRELIKNLDNLPFPKRAFMNKNKMISMVSSRGCAGNCTYCSIISLYRSCKGQIYRNRSAQNIVDEIEYLDNTYGGIKNICFFDDNFFENTECNNRKVFELIDLLDKKQIKIPFSLTSCAKDIIRLKNILPELKRNGLYKVFIGIESFVQRQLDFYNKNITVDENILAIKIIQELGLELSLGLIMFDPEVSLDEIKTNFITLKNMNIVNSGMSPFSLHTYLVAVRGTAFMNSLVKNNEYVHNSRGYNFKCSLVEAVMKYIDMWSEFTMPLIGKNHLIEVANEKGEVRLANNLKLIYLKFIDLDIDYVLDLCSEIENDKRLNKLHDHYCIEYEKIYDEFELMLLQSKKGDI